MTVAAFELSHTDATLPVAACAIRCPSFVGIMAVASTAVRRQSESGDAAHRVPMQLLLGSQSCLARAPFCCSIRYRVVRKKRSFRTSLVRRPLPAIYIQSWHAHFYRAGGPFNIEAGGEGAAGIEERFFRTTREPHKERFFRTHNEEN